MGQSRSRAKVDPVTIDPPPSEPSQCVPSTPVSPSSSIYRLNDSSTLHNGVFESFLIQQEWAFTGLQPEDGQPPTSASNFMILKIQHNQPNTVIFEPLSFERSMEPSIQMIWNLPNGELTWQFTGAHWKNPEIRRQSLIIFEMSKDPTSATVAAMIMTLKLPTRLQDLPLKTDHLGLVLNEERLVFHKKGVHWIRSTEKEAFEHQTPENHQTEVNQCRKMYNIYVSQHLEELKADSVVVYHQIQSIPEIYSSRLEASQNLKNRTPIFHCTYQGCHAQEIKGLSQVGMDSNTLSIESINKRSRLSYNSQSKSARLTSSRKSQSRSPRVTGSPTSRSKSTELPTRRLHPQFVL